MGIKGSTLVLLASLAVFNLKSDAKLFSQTFPESSKCLLIDSTILSTKYSPEKRNADMFGSHEHAKSKLDYLKPEMEKYCGKTGDVAYDYFKTSFDSVYIGKIDSLPEAKERVGAFLLWLSKKPGLFEEFIKDCNDGKVEFTVHVSDYEDIRSSLAVFGFWTGMKYAGETIVKKLSSTRASKINIIESNISGSVVVPCRDDTAYTAYFGRIKGLDAPEQSIVAGVTIGIHEGAHCLNRSGFLSESAAAFLQDMLGLPVPLLESLK
ncbi:MAG: hypothetical protein NTV88_02520, partial [Candidatus Micrarchaeota archaeon]|nr:hypothetical protein [Candidatus Micrarchaeota archaeon]